MKLNLPTYACRIREENGKRNIFDSCRKKWVPLTPEEWVRQHFIHFLIEEKNFPKSLIAVEFALKINRQDFRSDIVLFNNSGKPVVAVECKAPHIKISQQTFDQIARYNMQLNVNYLIVTNGINHYCCHIEPETNNYTFLPQIPNYKDL